MALPIVNPQFQSVFMALSYEIVYVLYRLRSGSPGAFACPNVKAAFTFSGFPSWLGGLAGQRRRRDTFRNL